MHEYPITCEIIGIAEDYAGRYGAKEVLQINLVIGDDSGFIGDSIEMYFEVIAKGTLCEGAHIEIEYIKPLLRCVGCQKLFERTSASFTCPSCHQIGRPTTIGKEFYIKSIEVDLEGG